MKKVKLKNTILNQGACKKFLYRHSKNYSILTSLIFALQVCGLQPTYADNPNIGGIKGIDLMPGFDKSKSKSEKSSAYLQNKGANLGVKNPDKELKVLNTRSDKLGFTTITYQQEYSGIPVIGGQVKAHFDKDGNLYSLTNTYLPNVTVNPTPSIHEDNAKDTALKSLLTEYGPLTEPIITARLTVINLGVIQGARSPEDNLAFEIHVIAKNAENEMVDDLVYIDAHQGNKLLKSSNIHDALQRRAYDLLGNPNADAGLALVYPNSPVWVEGNTLPTPISAVNRAINFTGATYNLFLNLFERDGPDFIGSKMDVAVNWGVLNAFNRCTVNSTEQLSVFGTVNALSLASDDIVGHEWGHCYHTHSTGGFIYSHQSGAVGEAFSDIVGEVVDSIALDSALYVNDDLHKPPRQQISNNGGACSTSKFFKGAPYSGPDLPKENSNRWLQSEEFLLRDLWNPHCTNNPEKVSDPVYTCSFTLDNGGVHYNSTIISHVFALLSDGGSFNGAQIRKIGQDKAFPIFYRAIDTYSTPTTNFSQYADNLMMSCRDLIGEKVTSIDSLNKIAPITSADCGELEKAITAGELRQAPNCPPETNNIISQSNIAIPPTDACGTPNGRRCESLVGDVVADTMRAQLGTDFALHNSGGIRAGLTCPATDDPLDPCPAYISPPPPYIITDGQVRRVIPFITNLAVKVRVSGVQIKDILENGVSFLPGNTGNGRYPQISGLCFTYDISATPRTTLGTGNRVKQVFLQAPNGGCSTTPLDVTDPTPRYLMGTLDFIANGGDGYPVIPPEGGVTYGPVVDLVIPGIQGKLLAPTIQGRSKCITSGATPCPVILP